jgi:hypothetical protein
MRRDIDAVRLSQAALLGAVGIATAYLAVLAVDPAVRESAPGWLRWFGRPGSGPTIAIVALGIVALCVFAYRSNAARARGSVSLTLVLALTVMNCLLGLASYWNCHDAAHPVFITPLMWTAQLVKGGTSELRMKRRRMSNTYPGRVGRCAVVVAWGDLPRGRQRGRDAVPHPG